MRASADATHRRLGGPGRWLLALPPTFVAGLQVLFRSVRAGLEPVVLGDGGLERAVGSMTGGRRYVSLVPTQVHRVLADPGATGALSRFDAVLVGGAALDTHLRDDATAAAVPVVTTYGMAETCGGCVYEGVPLDGVRVSAAADGRLRIGGATLFEGYDGDPRLTSEVLQDGWFTTQDLGRVGPGGLVRVEGRADDVVVSGGVNVPTGVVAARLRAHPQVRDAVVVGVPDDEWGQVVVAVADTSLGVDELRDWVGEMHPRSFAPRRLLRVDAMPLLPNGKVDRLAVEAIARG